MIVSESKGFVFMHNPKCAGTTVREHLMQFETTGDYFWKDVKIGGHQVDKAHMPLHIIKNHYGQYFAMIENLFVFMFSRNPYSRVVSAFNEGNVPAFRALIQGPNKEQALSDYKRDLNDFIANMGAHQLTGYMRKFRHHVRQKDFVYIGNKRYVDLIMRLEDWPRCLESLGVFLPEIANILSASAKKHARPMEASALDYLSDASVNKINSIYREDFILFNYEVQRVG